MKRLFYKITSHFLRSFKIKLISKPFISGDTFRSLTKHIFESESDSLNINLIKQNDIIFVVSHFLPHFFEVYHPKIKVNYILISHNSDFNITETFQNYIDNKIIKWYAQNNTIISNKVVSIPIGLENLNYMNNGLISKFKINNINKPYLNKIFVCFNLETNYKERHNCLSVLKKYSNSFVIEDRIPNRIFFKYMKSIKFIASPIGNGLDCHRTWEAIYLNVIPVLLKDNFSIQFSDLPILLIDKWEDFLVLSEDELNKLYSKIKSTKSKNKINFSYWEKLIRNPLT